ESKANSRKHRSLKQILGVWRRQRTKRRTVTAVGVRPVIPVYDKRGEFSGFLAPLETAGPSVPDSISEGPVHSPSLEKTTNKKGKHMKKFLLIALVASGLLFVPVPRSDAGVWVGGGYYFPYSGYGYYRPYYGTFYQPYYSYYYGPSYYWRHGHRVYYRHHHHHYYHD